jgi:hypothetical protein
MEKLDRPVRDSGRLKVAQQFTAAKGNEDHDRVREADDCGFPGSSVVRLTDSRSGIAL